MSALRDVEARAGSTVELVELVVLVLRAQADLYSKFQVSAMADGEFDEYDWTLAEEVGSRLARIRPNAPESLERFQKQLQRHEVGNPSGDFGRYSTDRSPRHERQLIDGVKARTDVVIAPDGTVLGTD